LRVEVVYDNSDCDFEDNICIQIIEECPENEKVFVHDETNLFITPEQAIQLARLLSAAAQTSVQES
jgi:hypothetical protein